MLRTVAREAAGERPALEAEEREMAIAVKRARMQQLATAVGRGAVVALRMRQSTSNAVDGLGGTAFVAVRMGGAGE